MIWKNPCLLCGCGISVYWPNCPCTCHKGEKSNIIVWNNEKKVEIKPVPTEEKEKTEEK